MSGYTYWWRDPRYGVSSDLEPLRGYEGKFCGGRHSDRFTDAKNSSGGWANVYVEGGKAHHRDRANEYHVECRYCGDRLRGTAAGVEAQDSEPEKPRSYRRREAQLAGREHRGVTVMRPGGADEPQSDVAKPKSRAARIHQASLKRTGTRRDPTPGGDRGYTGRHRVRVFDT